MTEKQSALDLLLEEVTDEGDGLEQPTPVETQPDETTASEPESEPEERPSEDVEIDGLKVTYSHGEDGELEAQLPDEYEAMSDEQKASFDRKVDEGTKTLAKLKQERMQQKDKDRRIAELEAELAKSKQTDAMPEARPSEITSPTDLKKYWGVETWAEVADLQVDDPEAYHKGFAKQAEEAAISAQKKVAADQKIHNAILSAGYNYAEVKEFADQNNITNLSVALDYYQLKNPKVRPSMVRKVPPATLPSKSTPTPPAKKTQDDKVNDILYEGAKRRI